MRERQSAERVMSDSTLGTAISDGGRSGSNLLRRFAGHKISKVRFLADQAEFTGHFVSVSQDSHPNVRGSLTLWQCLPSRDGWPNDLQRKGHFWLDKGVDIGDICVVNAQQVIASTSAGDVHLLDCSLPEVGSGPAAKLSSQVSFSNIHKTAASTALCLLGEQIFTGSDSGQIIRIFLTSSESDAVRPFADDLMAVTCLASSDQSTFVSGHSTGQIHLWDVRRRPISAEFGVQPLVSRPVTTFNNAITSLAVHPVEHKLVGFGTQSGEVAFLDLRRIDQPLPIAFKVAQEPINQLKFHPLFSNNCFSCTDSGLIHWDGSALAREVGPFPIKHNLIDPSMEPEAELIAAAMEEDDGPEHKSIWLSARASTIMQLRVLLGDEPQMLSSFDVVQGAMIIGSRSMELTFLGGLNFTN